MLNPSFFPRNEAQGVLWLENFSDKFKIYGHYPGVSEKEFVDTLADIKYYIWYNTIYYPRVQQYIVDVNNYVNEILNGTSEILIAPPVLEPFENMPAERPCGILPRLFHLIDRLRDSPNYRNGFGKHFGIDSTWQPASHFISDVASPRANSKMARKIKRLKHRVHISIDFKLYEHAAVAIESRRNGSQWERLTIATESPWRDSRLSLIPDMIEVREYRLAFCDYGVVSDVFSPVLSIIVEPR